MSRRVQLPLPVWRKIVATCREHQQEQGQHVRHRLRIHALRDVADIYRAPLPPDELLSKLKGTPVQPPEEGCLALVDVAYDYRGYRCLFGWYGGDRVELWAS